jgi:hypothetical protein
MQMETPDTKPVPNSPQMAGCQQEPCCALSDLLPPAEIVDAAEKVRVWMESNGYRNWQLGGVCDRRFATDRDEWKEVANGSLLGTIKQRDAAVESLRSIAVADWKTSGELRKMARDAYSSAHD